MLPCLFSYDGNHCTMITTLFLSFSLSLSLYIYIYIYTKIRRSTRDLYFLNLFILFLNINKSKKYKSLREPYFKIYPYSFFGPTTTIFIYIYIYIYIYSPTDRLSLSHNASVWLDTRDASNWDRNQANFTSAR